MVTSFIKNSKIVRLLVFPAIFLRRAFLKYKNRKLRFYDKLWDNVTGGSLIVNIKDIPGSIEIDYRSDLLKRVLIEKKYEPEIVSLVKENVSNSFDAINVGANIGIFTILLAQLIKKTNTVLAIEPTPIAFSYLKNNLKINNLNNVYCYNGICSDVQGNYNLNIIPGKEEYSSLSKSQYLLNIKSNIETLTVPAKTLDSLATEFNIKPGLIIIDTEGAEMKVLKGAIQVIEYYHPIIISELDDDMLRKQDSSASEILKFLDDIGYKVKNIRKNKTIKAPFKGNIIANYVGKK